MQIKVNKLPKSEVEIEGEIEADAFEVYFSKALKRIGEHLEIDGFRKGKIIHDTQIHSTCQSKYRRRNYT